MKKKLLIIIGLTAIVYTMAGCASSAEKIDVLQTNTNETINTKDISNIIEETDEEIETSLPEDYFLDGQYKVGTDIPSGEYMLIADGSAYFSITEDSNGNNIITNDLFKNNSIISIMNGKYLELSGCYAVPFDETVDIVKDKTELSDGMYKVGLHISSGEYKLQALDGDNGYYCIYDNLDRENIVANNNFKNSNYVTVSDGQYLLLSGCSLELNNKNLSNLTHEENKVDVYEDVKSNVENIKNHLESHEMTTDSYNKSIQFIFTSYDFDITEKINDIAALIGLDEDSIYDVLIKYSNNDGSFDTLSIQNKLYLSDDAIEAVQVNLHNFRVLLPIDANIDNIADGLGFYENDRVYFVTEIQKIFSKFMDKEITNEDAHFLFTEFINKYDLDTDSLKILEINWSYLVDGLLSKNIGAFSGTYEENFLEIQELAKSKLYEFDSLLNGKILTKTPISTIDLSKYLDKDNLLKLINEKLSTKKLNKREIGNLSLKFTKEIIELEVRLYIDAILREIEVPEQYIIDTEELLMEYYDVETMTFNSNAVAKVINDKYK